MIRMAEEEIETGKEKVPMEREDIESATGCPATQGSAGIVRR